MIIAIDECGVARAERAVYGTEENVGQALRDESIARSELFITTKFDGGKVVDYLKTVKTWLDANPDEVLTLLFTNPEDVSLTDVWKPAFDDAGITDLAYVPPSLPVKQGDWPTLGELLNSGKRVVVFLDANADPSQVDFILPEFDMVRQALALGGKKVAS